MTTLKDLAAQLGVSIATVSRALRSSPEIGPEMQKRVKELARKLNYRPNPYARSLRRDSPKIIGVVVPNIVTHFYSAVLDGIEREAAAHGYSVISANSHEDTTDEIHAVDNFLTPISSSWPTWSCPWCSSGALVCPTSSPPSPPTATKLPIRPHSICCRQAAAA